MRKWVDCKLIAAEWQGFRWLPLFGYMAIALLLSAVLIALMVAVS